MKKIKQLFSDSLHEFTVTKNLVLCGLMAAIAIVLSMVASISIGPYVKIGFSGIPNRIVEFLFGPVVGCIFGGALDLLKFMIKPDGPFFFGVANKFDECMKTIGDKPRIRIIRMRKVPFMDTTGLHNLESLYRLSTKEKIQVILSGVNEQVRATLVKSSFARTIGEENICSNIHEALKRAEVCLKS